MLDLNLARITGFQWDSGNAEKNTKHGVERFEAEQVFFNDPLLLLADIRHSQIEKGSMRWASPTATGFYM